MILTIQPLKLTKPCHSPFHSITTTTTTTILCSNKKGPFRRRKYNSSRRSVLKKTFIQEQVKFSAPVSDDPVVAIIGGGISGLLCALSLEKRGVRSTVFDTVCFFLYYLSFLYCLSYLLLDTKSHQSFNSFLCTCTCSWCTDIHTFKNF